MSQQVIVGTVGRPHGLRGEVLVRPRTDHIEDRFAVGAVLRSGSRELWVAGTSTVAGRLVVRFDGVGDRVAAEALRGLDLWAEADADELDPDEFHDTALVGLAAVDPDGAALGEVIAIEHHGVQDLLVVRTPAGDRLVPFVSALVPEVNLAARCLVINPIPGLLSEVDDAD
jgi:16S rRNA processing protein RimM